MRQPSIFFCECDFATGEKMGLEFEIRWKRLSGTGVTLNTKSIIFGYFEAINLDLLFNLCILLVKKAIYNCRFRDTLPPFSYFIS